MEGRGLVGSCSAEGVSGQAGGWLSRALARAVKCFFHVPLNLSHAWAAVPPRQLPDQPRSSTQGMRGHPRPPPTPWRRLLTW